MVIFCQNETHRCIEEGVGCNSIRFAESVKIACRQLAVAVDIRYGTCFILLVRHWQEIRITSSEDEFIMLFGLFVGATYEFFRFVQSYFESGVAFLFQGFLLHRHG